MTGPDIRSHRKSRSRVGFHRMRLPARMMVTVYLLLNLSFNRVAEAKESHGRPLRSRMSAQGENRARFDGDRAIGIAADEDDDHPCKKVPLKGCVNNADDFVSAYNNEDEEFVVICQDTTISLTGAAGALSVLADGVSKTVACENANKAGFPAGSTPSTSCTLRGDEATSNFQVVNEATLRFCSVHFEDWGENDMIFSIIVANALARIYVSGSLFQDNALDSAMLSATNSSIEVSKSSFADNQGADMGVFGLYNSSSLELSDCSFEDNIAQVQGAVVYSESSSTVLAQNCLFDGNRAELGGAFYMTKSVLRLGKCQLTDNQATQAGGFLYADDTVVYFDKSAAEGNIAEDGGGGVMALANADVYVTDSNFVDNESESGTTASSGKGGVFYATDRSEFVLERTQFETNAAEEYGGVFFLLESILIMTDTKFVSNSCDDYDGGSVFIDGESSILATNCLFKENQARYGGAVASRNTTITNFQKCLFQSNRGREQGGAIDAGDQTTSKFVESKLQSNEAPQGGAAAASGEASFLFEDSALLLNAAFDGNGGALYLTESPEVQILGSTFFKNEASDYGKDVWADSKDIFVECYDVKNLDVIFPGGTYVCG